jgi:hypothetical protein
MLKFVDVFGRWEASELSQLEAAELLGMGEGTFRRWSRRYEEESEVGLDRCEEVEHLYRTRYPASRRGTSTSTWCGIIGSPGATAGPKRSCRAAICWRRRRVVVHTGASAALLALSLSLSRPTLRRTATTSGPEVTERSAGTHETVPHMGAIMLPCEMSGDAGRCRGDPGRTCR